MSVPQPTWTLSNPAGFKKMNQNFGRITVCQGNAYLKEEFLARTISSAYHTNCMFLSNY